MSPVFMEISSFFKILAGILFDPLYNFQKTRYSPHFTDVQTESHRASSSKSQTQSSEFLVWLSFPGPDPAANTPLISSKKCFHCPKLGYLTCHWSPLCQGGKFSDKCLKAKGLKDRTYREHWPPPTPTHRYLLIHSYSKYLLSSPVFRETY